MEDSEIAKERERATINSVPYLEDQLLYDDILKQKDTVEIARFRLHEIENEKEAINHEYNLQMIQIDIERLTLILLEDEYYKEHPEYFPMITSHENHDLSKRERAYHDTNNPISLHNYYKNSKIVKESLYKMVNLNPSSKIVIEKNRQYDVDPLKYCL